MNRVGLRVAWPGTAGVLGVQSGTSDRRLGSAQMEKKEPRRYCPFSAQCGARLFKQLRSDYEAGVSPQKAKSRHGHVPRECGCQGESKNSSVQKERRRYGNLRDQKQKSREGRQRAEFGTVLLLRYYDPLTGYLRPSSNPANHACFIT